LLRTTLLPTLRVVVVAFGYDPLPLARLPILPDVCLRTFITVYVVRYWLRYLFGFRLLFTFTLLLCVSFARWLFALVGCTLLPRFVYVRVRVALLLPLRCCLAVDFIVAFALRLLLVYVAYSVPTLRTVYVRVARLRYPAIGDYTLPVVALTAVICPVVVGCLFGCYVGL